MNDTTRYRLPELELLDAAAPLPKRAVVGGEAFNSERKTVSLRAVMESDAWRNSRAELPVALGEDVSGDPVVIDLARTPHLLVAGTTGTGKSVCLNSIIMSLLFKFRPDELKFVMVDTGGVEFAEYRELPHLFAPVINDPDKVPVALRWLANERDRRYLMFARTHSKNIFDFNHRQPDPEPVYDDDGSGIPAKMPYIVAVIDDLADLMTTPEKAEIERCIARIAQHGPPGIHLVIATRRPSPDTATSVIKAHLPTRLCFRMGTRADSRAVLDIPGAEKLLGAGDMLVMSPANMTIGRVQGSFVSDENIRGVVKFACGQAKPGFNTAALAEADEELPDGPEPDDTEELPRAELAPPVDKFLRPGDGDDIRRAIEIAILDRKMSTSYLQRRLKIGYNRAADIVELLEERRVVGPPSGSGNKREVLIRPAAESTE